MEGVSVEFEAKSARDGAWYQNIIISHTSFIVPSLVMSYRILTFDKECIHLLSDYPSYYTIFIIRAVT